jgi:hypothetical protein
MVLLNNTYCENNLEVVGLVKVLHGITEDLIKEGFEG